MDCRFLWIIGSRSPFNLNSFFISHSTLYLEVEFCPSVICVLTKLHRLWGKAKMHIRNIQCQFYCRTVPLKLSPLTSVAIIKHAKSQTVNRQCYICAGDVPMAQMGKTTACNSLLDLKAVCLGLICQLRCLFGRPVTGVSVTGADISSFHQTCRTLFFSALQCISTDS